MVVYHLGRKGHVFQIIITKFKIIFLKWYNHINEIKIVTWLELIYVIHLNNGSMENMFGY